MLPLATPYHHELTFSVAQFRPQTADVAVVLRVRPALGTLVFHDQDAPVVQCANEVGIEPAIGFLQETASA